MNLRDFFLLDADGGFHWIQKFCLTDPGLMQAIEEQDIVREAVGTFLICGVATGSA